MNYPPSMAASEKVRQLAESYAGLSAEERSEFVSLVPPDVRAQIAVTIRMIRARESKEEGDFNQAMDKVFGHHAPLLKKLAQ